MGAPPNIVDLCSPARIAEAIVKVNQVPELRHAGLGVLWKLYYAAEHSLTRLELESAGGELENHFGLYCRRVAEELGATALDALPLVNSSRGNHGLEVITLKPAVVTAIEKYAFSNIGLL
jgi:hypothetical protein